MSANEREEMMVERYGEVCTRTVAARILGRSTGTINNMLSDGRLDAACAGTMVDVRSIARYISQPAQSEFEARKTRMKRRRNSNWAV